MDEVTSREVRVVRLLSTPAVNAAGLLSWAMAGYQAELHRQGPVGPFIAALGDVYHLGTLLSERVLRGETRFVLQGEDVELRLSQAEAEMFDAYFVPTPQMPKTTVVVR